jgi:hypothetical protein
MQGEKGETNMKNNIEEKEVTEYLPCILTDTELLSKSRELAKANEDLVAVEARKKDVDADLKAQVTKIEANIGVLSRSISQGKEWRNVKCKMVFDYTKGIKQLIRQDTMEIIKSDFLSQSERQESMIQ